MSDDGSGGGLRFNDGAGWGSVNEGGLPVGPGDD